MWLKKEDGEKSVRIVYMAYCGQMIMWFIKMADIIGIRILHPFLTDRIQKDLSVEKEDRRKG